ncbi:MAG: anaerobic ribonucleoside-triphosphate reductase activating protein [Desulfovibrionaceae bacterium]
MDQPAGVWNFVRGLERFSLCDWPGRTCAVVFLGGCNLRCPTCHNAELAWDMHSLPVIPQHRLKVQLAERSRWLDGVTVTGGEPTIAPGLTELLELLARLDLPVKLDSNGMRPAVVRELLHSGLVDTFAVDIKGPFELYPQLTGGAVSAAQAAENLGAILDMARANPRRFYFRTTTVPALTEDDVDTARSYLPRGFSLTLQDYVPPRRIVHALSDHEERRPVGDLVH